MPFTDKQHDFFILSMDCPFLFFAWSALRHPPPHPLCFIPLPPSPIQQHTQCCKFSLYPSPHHNLSPNIRLYCSYKPLGMSNSTLSIGRRPHLTWPLLLIALLGFDLVWDSIGINTELKNGGREEENEGEKRWNGGMNFAIVWQNSFVWFTAHAYTHKILVCTCFLWYSKKKNSGTMKDSSQNSFLGGHFEKRMNLIFAE